MSEESEMPRAHESVGGYGFSFAESDTIAVDAISADVQTAVVPVMFRRRGTDVTTEGTAF
ncbi:hypothetical protein [Candidatus Mycobacterium methanotrophicum]|uniref:hypothetical protein n=1 Tax=Candidatus Mycobacterium methanotrophicum TaxID=2943498 RepID=UPI001C55C6BC